MLMFMRILMTKCFVCTSYVLSCVLLSSMSHSSQSRIPDLYLSSSELLSILTTCHRSLHHAGDGLIADGLLRDTIRRVTTFGISLVKLDVRQESERHAEVSERASDGAYTHRYICIHIHTHTYICMPEHTCIKRTFIGVLLI